MRLTLGKARRPFLHFHHRVSFQIPTYDVLIIGAGPAGSSAAARTRAAGLTTLVVERQEFPRFRIGESLLPEGNHLLREIGVWDKVCAAGFVPKHGARFHLGHGDAEKKVVFANGLLPGLDSTWQVERARFDALLLDHARELGAEVRTATTVSQVDSRDDGHRVTLTAADGTTTEIEARYVIDSGGRDQFYSSDLKARLDPAAFPKRIAIYNHFTGVGRSPGTEGGDTVIVRIPEGWLWFIPVDAERTSVGLVATQTTFKSAGLKPGEFFERTVAAHPRVQALMRDARPTLGYHVTADYSYYRRELARGRMVLAGDAGGFLDPIFSSGVYLALHSAKEAAALVINAHRRGRAIADSTALAYTRRLKAHSSVFHRLIDAFYDEHSFSVFMCQVPPLGMGPAITSIVAGHAKLTFGMWWRFRVFLLVCRLQSRLRLVDPITVNPAPEATPA